jgi:DNA-binding NarL/FixJ family response regulator
LVEDENARATLAIVLGRSEDHALAQSVGLEVTRPRTRGGSLSPREREVLELVRHGLTNKEIARALFITESTAKVHVRHILDKLGARTRTEAASRVI